MNADEHRAVQGFDPDRIEATCMLCSVLNGGSMHDKFGIGWMCQSILYRASLEQTLLRRFEILDNRWFEKMKK